MCPLSTARRPPEESEKLQEILRDTQLYAAKTIMTFGLKSCAQSHQPWLQLFLSSLTSPLASPKSHQSIARLSFYFFPAFKSLH